MFGGYDGDYRFTSDVHRSTMAMGMWPDGKDKWTVSGYENESYVATEKGTLTAIGYCEKGAAPKVVQGKTVKVLQAHKGTALAACPAHTVVGGAGFSVPVGQGRVPLPGLLTELDRSSKSVASATILAYQDTTVTAYALCGPGPAPVERTSSTTVEAAKADSVTAECPKDTSLVFGGVAATDGYTSPKPAVFPFSVKAVSGGWKVSGYNSSLTTPGSVSAIVYCR